MRSMTERLLRVVTRASLDNFAERVATVYGFRLTITLISNLQFSSRL